MLNAKFVEIFEIRIYRGYAYDDRIVIFSGTYEEALKHAKFLEKQYNAKFVAVWTASNCWRY